VTFDEVRVRLEGPSRKHFGHGASEAEIDHAEQALGVRFPRSYRCFLCRFGWGGVGYLEIFGLGADAPPYLHVVNVTMRERTEMRPPLPRYLVPIMNDGAGNHHCLDTRTFSGDECPVAFWNHELGILQEPRKIAGSFSDWLAEQLTQLD